MSETKPKPPCDYPFRVCVCGSADHKPPPGVEDECERLGRHVCGPKPPSRAARRVTPTNLTLQTAERRPGQMAIHDTDKPTAAKPPTGQFAHMSTTDLMLMARECKERTPVEDAEFIKTLVEEIARRKP